MSNKITVCNLEEATDDNFAVTCTYNILFTNDMACSRVVELLYLLRKTAGISFQAEQAADRLEKQMKAYEKKMNEIYSVRSSFMADANQVIEDAIGKDLDMLQETVKNKFIESGCSHPVLMTAAEITHLFIDISIHGFDRRLREMSDRNIQDTGCLLYLRLTKLLKPCEELCNLLFKDLRLALNNKKSRKAIRSIIQKLTSAHLIAKAINEAEALNPA